MKIDKFCVQERSISSLVGGQCYVNRPLFLRLYDRFEDNQEKGISKPAR